MDSLSKEDIQKLLNLYDSPLLESNPILEGRNVKCKKRLLLYLRNRLIVLGNLTMGWRRNEWRTVKLKDVWDFENERPKTEVYRAPNFLKKKSKFIRDEEGNIIEKREIKLPGRRVIVTKKVQEWIADYMRYFRYIWDEEPDGDHYLFRSFKVRDSPISNMMFHNVVKGSFKDAGIDMSDRRLGTHSLRKTYARTIYDKTGKDINTTARLLGHRNVNSTMSYLVPRIDARKYDMDSIFNGENG